MTNEDKDLLAAFIADDIVREVQPHDQADQQSDDVLRDSIVAALETEAREQMSRYSFIATSIGTALERVARKIKDDFKSRR